MKSKQVKLAAAIIGAALVLGILYLMNSSGSRPSMGLYYPPVQPAGYGWQGNGGFVPASGGGGDNFWSTGHSAGNYDSGNTRGYVNVPGVGPVGYGF